MKFRGKKDYTQGLAGLLAPTFPAVEKKTDLKIEYNPKMTKTTFSENRRTHNDGGLAKYFLKKQKTSFRKYPAHFPFTI
jgi:hypothetical protein